MKLQDTLEVVWDRWEDPGGHDGPRHRPGPLEAVAIDGALVFTFDPAEPVGRAFDGDDMQWLVEEYCHGIALRVTSWEATGDTLPDGRQQIVLVPVSFDRDGLAQDAADADEGAYEAEMERRADARRDGD